MLKDFAFDLKVARRKSGLSQSDCAHLLNVHRTKISRIERGESSPSVCDICTLLLIYGKTFESLFETVFHDMHDALGERLATIPDQAETRKGLFNRSNTLNGIAARLETHNTHGHGAA